MPQSGRCPRAQPAAALGEVASARPPRTRLAHTDEAVVCSLPFPPPPEYKKKYGEEHGSCQAGIAGFFTEVGVSRPLRVFVSFLDLISVVPILVF